MRSEEHAALLSLSIQSSFEKHLDGFHFFECGLLFVLNVRICLLLSHMS